MQGDAEESFNNLPTAVSNFEEQLDLAVKQALRSGVDEGTIKDAFIERRNNLDRVGQEASDDSTFSATATLYVDTDQAEVAIDRLQQKVDSLETDLNRLNPREGML